MTEFSSSESAIAAIKRITEIAESIKAEEAIAHLSIPKGTEIVLEWRFFSPAQSLIVESCAIPPRLWKLVCDGTKVWGGWIPLTPELESEIQSICEWL